MENSSIKKLMNVLKKKIHNGKDIKYAVPELWNCFGYNGEEKKEYGNGVIYVNPYKFYYDCIHEYIMKDYNDKIDYNKSLSIIKNDFKNEYGYLGGDWKKKSSIYSMHIRTSTSWDHNGSGALENINGEGFKETGTFVKTLALLPLLKKMGIDTIYLLPISEYSNKFKKGGMGSPYAIKNFFKIDHNLKDTMTGNEFTIEEEFKAFVEACHILRIRVMIDVIPRTAARNNDLILEHPDWFYWIKTSDVDNYSAPYVEGVAPADKPSYDNLDLIYKSEQVWNHIKKFCESPNITDSEKWELLKKCCVQNPELDLLEKIEKEFGLTTAPAFADCLNDPQPAWSDITFLKLYMDHPNAAKRYVTDEAQAPYILFDTIKGDLFKGDIENTELWNIISGIIPYYQNSFGIDGARVDMGHALPSELVQMVLQKPRKIDSDFSFIAEELLVEGAEKSRNAGYNMIIGYGWWLEPRIFEHKTHEFMYNSINYKAPVFACAETPDTPRIAAREGGRILSKLVTVMNQFMPNAVPFINSGLELYETQPMNTGLDCRHDEKYRLSPEDAYNGKLAFFEKYSLHWDNPYRWDLPDTLEIVSKIRVQFSDTIANTENYIPVNFGEPETPAIGLAYVVEGKRWRQGDNVIMAVCNTDLYNEREFTLNLENIRQYSGNVSKKAWLAFSPNEWSHDIFDFDENYNLYLRFKPGEVKIIMM
ncbi:alpha-amylase family glycosyl hydrolase [Clostridium sp.]|uniref:alpha-amylase family glycosyl hydrolase n=1 Tax=Clostridium sp. TaxID=1506 RepID=UPI003D6CD05B